MIRTTISFTRLANDKFRKTTDVIVTSMTGNAYFPTLQPQVTALAAKAADYYALDLKAATRDVNALTMRNTARIELTTMLTHLGLGVSSVANGNVDMLTSSGFPFTKPTQKSAPLQKPKVPVVAAAANSGVATCKVQPQYAMKSATYYLSSDPAALTEGADAVWEGFPAGGSSFDYTNLTPGQRYYSKVALVGVRNQVVMSEAVSFIAQ